MPDGRVRSRYDLQIVPGHLTYTPKYPGAVAVPVSFSTTHFSFYEYMRDSFERPFSRKKLVPHAVEHDKVVVSCGNYPSWEDENIVRVSQYKPNISVDNVLNRVPLPSGMLVETNARRAFDSFNHQMPDITSLPNFVIELRDVGQLLPHLYIIRDKLVKALAKSLNGGFLSYQFGWKPLVSDMKALAGASEKILSRLRLLRESYGRTTKVHFANRNIVAPDNLNVDYDLQPGAQSFFMRLEHYDCTFRASAEMRHTLEGLDSDIAAIEAFNSALGLSNPVRTLWNALPYSFVLEWFVKMENLIENRALDPFQGSFDIFNTSCSYTVNAGLSLSAHPWPSYGNSRTRIGYVNVRRYRRMVGLPFNVSDILSTDLTYTQKALLAALAYAKVK